MAKQIRQRFPDMPIVLCADDDHRMDGYPGSHKGTEAARSVGGLVAVPDFGDDRPEDATDLNDLMRYRGREAVDEP